MFPLRLQTTWSLLTPSFLPHPCNRLERRIGGIKGKDHRLRWQQFTENGNEIRKWAVTTTVLITECSRMLTTQTPTIPNHSLPNTLTQKGHLPLFLGNDMRWCRITFKSKPWPCLATAKINPVLARTSTLFYVTIGYMQQKQNPKKVHVCKWPCLAVRVRLTWQTSCVYRVQCFKRWRGNT